MCLYCYRHLNRILWSFKGISHSGFWLQKPQVCTPITPPALKNNSDPLQGSAALPYCNSTISPHTHPPPPVAHRIREAVESPRKRPRKRHLASIALHIPSQCTADRSRPDHPRNKTLEPRVQEKKTNFLSVQSWGGSPLPPRSPRQGNTSGDSPWSLSRLSYREATLGRTDCKAGRAARGSRSS